MVNFTKFYRIDFTINLLNNKKFLDLQREKVGPPSTFLPFRTVSSLNLVSGGLYHRVSRLDQSFGVVSTPTDTRDVSLLEITRLYIVCICLVSFIYISTCSSFRTLFSELVWFSTKKLCKLLFYLETVLISSFFSLSFCL